MGLGDSLETAREKFRPVREEAVKFAEGREGYFVMTCPMSKADWVQKDRLIEQMKSATGDQKLPRLFDEANRAASNLVAALKSFLKCCEANVPQPKPREPRRYVMVESVSR